MSKSLKSRTKKHFDGEWNKLCYRKYPIKKEVQDGSTSDKNAIFCELQEEKRKLNQVKALLNSYDIKTWHKHTKNTHRFSQLPYVLHRTIKAELATQAWAKFYAILGSFNLLKGVSDNGLKSVHLCEAPGAFVSALNHFLVCNFGSVKWEWTATTFNPYYEGNELGKMIPDDRFLIETFSKWDFGCNFTGDIMSIENLRHFKEKFLDQNIQLVTADGSIDCSDAPDEQEATVTLLLFWEIIYALNILSNGGSFVLKIFTVFERSTLALLYLLSQVFGRVSFFKPGPSKPGNSEVYVVSQDFQKEHCLNLKLFADVQDVMGKSMDDLGSILDSVTVPDAFMQSILDYSRNSCALQKEAIQSNLQTFEKLSPEDRKHLHNVKQYFANRFIKEFGIVEIDDYISPLFVMKFTHGGAKTNKFYINFKTASYDQRKATNNKELVGQENRAEVKVFWYTSSVLLQPDYVFTTGKKIGNICSSTLCAPSLLKMYAAKKKAVSCNNKSLSEFIKVLPFHEKCVKLSICIQNSVLKEFFADFFEEKDIPVEIFISEKEINLSTASYVFCHLGNLFLNKPDSFQFLKSILECVQSSQTLVFVFEEIVLTNFWLGIFYIISQQFHKLLYFAPGSLNGCFYLVFDQYTSNQKAMKDLLDYLTSILQYLNAAAENVDILHVVPVNVLMQSDFRDYVKECNEYFISNYLE